MRIHAPQRTCSNTIEFRIVVSGSEGSAVPTGTVTFNDYTTTFGTYTLVPNGIPTQSEATVTLTFASGSTAVKASYSGDNIYGTASTLARSRSTGVIRARWDALPSATVT